ncbi:MAG: acyl-CoA dehydrogenase family protein, partial [Alphaproteobacteria bacterium]|nr:acyl-CoA dehydrogenase family protein [Alphaproteobacteria bacterium]
MSNPAPAMPVIEDLSALCAEALVAAETLADAAQRAVAERIATDGAIDAAKIDANQFAVHGYAWLATYVESLRQMRDWAARLAAAGRLRDFERLILQAAFGEYLNQIGGGIAMSQVEILRPADMGVAAADIDAFWTPAVRRLAAEGFTDAVRAAIAGHIANSLESGDFGDGGLEDESLIMVRDQFHRFVEEQVAPNAHDWHLKNNLIPIEVVRQMAELGVFGLTIPEENGGL